MSKTNLIYIPLIDILLNTLNINVEIINKSKQFHRLCISNHISEFDVIILYYVFNKYNINYRFIGDINVKNIPIFGNICDMENTIYIDRKNPSTAIKILNKLVSANDYICIFPEGTLYYKLTVEKSNKMCKHLKIPRFKNVLCPKISGFNTLVKIIKPHSITDITLKYVYDKTYTLKNRLTALTIVELLKNPPKKIIVIIKETETKDIMALFRAKDKQTF